MQKNKISLLVLIFMSSTNFIQAPPVEGNPTLGLALFCTTIACHQATVAWEKSQNKKDISSQDQKKNLKKTPQGFKDLLNEEKHQGQLLHKKFNNQQKTSHSDQSITKTKLHSPLLLTSTLKSHQFFQENFDEIPKLEPKKLTISKKHSDLLNKHLQNHKENIKKEEQKLKEEALVARQDLENWIAEMNQNEPEIIKQAKKAPKRKLPEVRYSLQNLNNSNNNQRTESHIPLLLTYTPEWHTQQTAKLDHQNINDQLIARAMTHIHSEKTLSEQKKLLQEIDALYRSNDTSSIEALLQKHISYFHDERSKIKNSNIEGRISTKHTYHPTKGLPQKVIFLEAVHGTWGNAGSYGQNTDKILSKLFSIYAQRLAIEHNAIVYLDAAEWSGNLNKDKRQAAGKALAQEIMQEINLIKEQNPQATISIQTIGHSHGCNVINFMSEELKTQGLHIDHAIFLGSPKPDIKTLHIQKILNIFGNLDFTGSMGSLLSSNGASSSLRQEGTEIQNVILKLNGQDLNHTSIKLGAMSFLPLLEDYLKSNFTNQQHLIVDVYNQQEYQQKSNVVHDEDELEIITQAPGYNYTIAGMIDEVYSELGCADETVQNSNPSLIKSNLNRDEFYKRYQNKEQKPLHHESTLLEKLISEGQAAQFPTWILTTLQHINTQSTTISTYTHTIITWIHTTFFKPASPTTQAVDPIEQFHKNITIIKNNIAKESSFKKKSLMIAQLYAQAQEFDDLETQSKILKTITESLGHENTTILQWQYNYEWIIGKTRTTDNPNWTPKERQDLIIAQQIYEQFKSLQNRKPQELLNNYEQLDLPTQQALNSALEQGLKIINIDEITDSYLKTKLPSQEQNNLITHNNSSSPKPSTTP